MPGSKSGLTHPDQRLMKMTGQLTSANMLAVSQTLVQQILSTKIGGDAVFHRMQQDAIRSLGLATPEKLTAIQADGLSLEPLASNSRAAIW